ncbi:MAG: glycosyltransferase [Proteobacteria bacterium]|nr:glycosyltransferase [Pseudomonadota bacterium]
MREEDNIHLVLAGPINNSIKIPDRKNVHYLGALAHERVPDLFNSLDLGVIYNLKSQFGLYCFPQKAYEILACQLPVVAANVGAMSSLFADFPDCLYEPDNSDSLVAAIKRQMQDSKSVEIKIPSWREQGNKFSLLIKDVLANNVVRG